MKQITLIIVVVAVCSFFVGRYYAPAKKVVEIKTVDKNVYIDRVITETKYINSKGETKVVTVTSDKTVEVEKIKEVTKFEQYNWIAGASIGIDNDTDKYISLDVSRKILGNVYISLGTTSNLNRQIFGLGLKYNF